MSDIIFSLFYCHFWHFLTQCTWQSYLQSSRSFLVTGEVGSQNEMNYHRQVYRYCLQMVCLSVVSISVRMFVCFSVCWSVYPSVYLFVCLFFSLYICLPVCLSVCIFVCLSVCLFVYPCVCLSLWLVLTLHMRWARPCISPTCWACEPSLPHCAREAWRQATVWIISPNDVYRWPQLECSRGGCFSLSVHRWHSPSLVNHWESQAGRNCPG